MIPADEPEVTLDSLYNKLQGRLFNFLVSRTGDSDEAEDILQEVFLRIHTNLDRIKDIEYLESWIFQVARNCLIDAYRRKKPTDSLIEYAVEDDYEEPDARQQLAGYLKDIVLQLPEPYREALVLTEYEGLSQAAAAERLGISLSGVKSRVQRARVKVKDLLLACCHVDFDRRGQVCCFRTCCPCCEQANLTVF